MWRACVLFLLMMGCSVPIIGQSEITFGNVQLRLGMSKETVRDKLSSAEYFAADWEDETVLLTARSAGYSGTVSFANGKLVKVYRFWHETSQAEALKLATVLHDLVTTMSEGGHHAATVVAWTKREPRYKMQLIDIAYGPQKMVRLRIQEGTILGKPYREVGVDECFGACMQFIGGKEGRGK